MSFKIKKASLGEAKEAARIHYELIPTGFLHKLGYRFISILYETLNEYPESVLFVAYDETERVCGYICGFADKNRFMDYFKKSKKIKIILALLPKIFSIKTIRGIKENMKHKNRDFKDTKTKAELFSIGVLPEYHGKGIAGMLLKELNGWFDARGIKKYIVVVGEELKRADSFYLKSGAVFLCEYELHKGIKSKVYAISI